jgi:hypothetical protein
MGELVEERRQRMWRGVFAGTIATILMSALLVAAPAFTGVRLPELVARALGGMRERPLWMLAGVLLHFAYGALAGAFFAAATERVNVASGLFFGLALWGIAVAVYAPLVGLGFVASHEPALAALLLPAHLLYGATIGALAPRGEIVQPINDRWPLGLADA